MRQKLGQHFLVNKEVLRKIAGALQTRGKNIVVEIGAGHGELTRELRATNKTTRIIAIEKDGRLARGLKNFFARDPKTEIIEGDALALLPSIISRPEIKNFGFKVAGNIPYYITGRLIRLLAEQKKKPELAVFTIQKEVAERLTARPPKMNLLAAATQIWTGTEIITTLAPQNFAPPPRVKSAIIRLTPRKTKFPKSYFKLARILFKQPRKTLLNNLASGLKISKPEANKLLGDAELDPNSRPQILEIEKISRLSETIS